jgi:hypothetical protein
MDMLLYCDPITHIFYTNLLNLTQYKVWSKYSTIILRAKIKVQTTTLSAKISLYGVNSFVYISVTDFPNFIQIWKHKHSLRPVIS